MINKNEILHQLKSVNYPGFNRDIVSFGIIKEITVDNDAIKIELALKTKNEDKKNEVVKSINEIGFENSAATYSFSESAKIGGDIGWINENSLNNNIRKNISSLKVGEFTKPIILSNGILILKLINIKNSTTTIDIENELKKAINYERNRQLNQYSKIYYNKIKKNLDFNG